jgi:hypothetical protein
MAAAIAAIAPCSQYGPAVVGAEEPIRRAPHVHHVLRMRADAAKNAEHGLHQERRLDQLAFGEMSEVVQVANVVAFELEARAIFRQCSQCKFDIFEGVAKNEIAGALQILPLPFVLEVLEPVQHRKQAEVHRSHVQGGELRLEADGGFDALFDRHEGAAAAREVHDGVGGLLDACEERLERLRRLVGPAGLGVAGVKMQDRCACLGGLERRVRRSRSA